MIFEKEFKNIGYNEVIGYSGKDITDKMLDECLKLNSTFYKPEFAWKPEIKEFISQYSQMCFVFCDTSDNSVMGYSFWLPIKTKVFNEFIRDKKTLFEFKEEYFMSYKDKLVNLFLASEAFKTGYDIKNLHKAVEDIFQKRILDMAYNQIFVKYVAIDAKCEFDKKLIAKKLGLSKAFQKGKSTFFFDEYSPNKTYSDSKYAENLKSFYPIKKES